MKKTIKYILVNIIFFAFITQVNAEDIAGDIKETVLKNGLKIITKEVHSAPVVSVSMYYRVGSRNESDSISGISHIVEHMLFRTTKKFKAGESSTLISQIGGEKNGFTSYDCTAFWLKIPSQYVDNAVEILADRMTGGLFLNDEFEAEKNVILSELDGNENHPFRLLGQRVRAASFVAHPYRRAIIGWRDVVSKISRDEIVDFYRKYYVPENAFIVVVGDFNTGEVISKIKKNFENLKKTNISHPSIPKEPDQKGERRVYLKEQSSVSYLCMSYHSVNIDNPDYFPLEVLNVILSAGKSSLLYKSLVETGIVNSAGSYLDNFKDPGLFSFYAVAKPDINRDEIEKTFDDIIEKIKNEGIAEYELQKAKNQVKAEFSYSSEDIDKQSREIGTFEINGNYKDYDKYLDNVNKVSLEDLKRVANKYLNKDNRTIGWIIPQKSAEQKRMPVQDSDSSKIMGNKKFTLKSLKIEKSKWKFISPVSKTLDNKMTIMAKKNDASETVAFVGNINAGSIFDSADKKGLANFVSEMILESSKELTAKLEFLGADVDFKCNKEFVEIKGDCLKDNFGEVLKALSYYLTSAEFGKEEMEKVRQNIIAGIKMKKEQPSDAAFDEFNRLLYPDENPLHYNSLGDEESVAKITLQDITDFYNKFYRPDSTILSVVGNINENEAIKQAEESFNKWKAGSGFKQADIKTMNTSAEQVRKDIVLNKPESIVIIGQSGIERKNKDYYSFFLLMDIFGASREGRLWVNLRENKGLTYGVYSFLGYSRGVRPFITYVQVHPANVEIAVKEILSEMDKIKQGGITEEELQMAKNRIISKLPQNFITNKEIAGFLTSVAYNGIGFDFINQYYDIIGKITKADVERIAKQYFHPDKIYIVVAGAKLK